LARLGQKRAVRRYADFNGRSRRKEYWMFALLNLLIVVGIIIVGGLFGSMSSDPASMLAGPGAILLIIYALGIFIPSLAVQVRRFHDQDKSGWFVLLNFIPYLGGIVVLVFMCLEGTRGDNRFGPDPKAGG
jgi:uncharacterized membrane protein YhaH (DUF805 family)